MILCQCKLMGVSVTFNCFWNIPKKAILLTKTTAARNEIALSYHRVRGLYLMAVVFAATIFLQ